MDIHALRGYTLIETLTTLSIVAILANTAIPGLQQLYINSQQTSRVNAFISFAHLARSEAIKRNQRVVFCPSSDGANCEDEPEWEIGWLVFADQDGDRETDPEDQIIQVSSQYFENLTIHAGTRKRITYQPTGTAGGSNGTYVFCDRRGSEYAKAVIISNTGRPRVATERSDGKPLSCG